MNDTPPPVSHPFHFTGNAGEYFRIWIVNLLLSLVTLGFYSPWAKVRRLRYFYGNTRLDGAAFDYLAEPMRILKGRLIALGILLPASYLSSLYPDINLLVTGLLVLVYPWFILRSRQFTLINTMHRGLRFRFTGSYRGALNALMLAPIAAIITLGLSYPYYLHAKGRYLVAMSQFGSTPFTFHATPATFYHLMPRAAGMALATLLVAMAPVLFGSLMALIATDAITAQYLIAYLLQFTFIPLLVILILVVFLPWYRTRLFNLTWNHTTLGEHRFQSTLRARDMIGLYLGNTLAILFSLGLAIPWARIRMARYRFSHLALVVAGDLDGFIQGEAAQVGALGEEMGDFQDFDLGL